MSALSMFGGALVLGVLLWAPVSAYVLRRKLPACADAVSAKRLARQWRRRASLAIAVWGLIGGALWVVPTLQSASLNDAQRTRGVAFLAVMWLATLLEAPREWRAGMLDTEIRRLWPDEGAE